MNGITSRCISFAQGNKDCFQRVNYEFGLVLGVDEFVDEQCYFLEKEYMHNRALHGYGTVSGLLVGKDTNGEDIEVQVEPGIGIDQYGRLFVIRSKQCASLLSWLDDQEDFDGQTIYVVARYNECETALVPIAGQPCSTSDQQMAPSRIQDSFAIELTLKKPDMPARDAVVNLAEFLSRFRVDPAAPDRSDLGTATRLAPIIGPAVIAEEAAAYITRVDNFVADETGVPGATILNIQPVIVESLLNDIFTYWVTEVRPTLNPDLIDPDAPETADGDPFPPEILLAELNLTFSEDDTLTLDGIDIDNTTRPYLLHTQLIQELFDIPELAGEGGETAPQKEVAEFVSIEDISTRVLNLWFHIDQNMSLVGNENVSLIRVEGDGTLNTITIRDLSEDVGRRNDVGRYYRLISTVDLNDGDFLLLRFDTDRIRVGDTNPITLSRFIAEAAFTYENYNALRDLLFAFHIVDRPDTIDEEQIRKLILELLPPPEPVIPFVTITPITLRNTILQGYELWFHLDGIVDLNDGGIENLSQENMAMYAEIAPGIVKEVPLEAIQFIRPNVWMVIPEGGQDQASPLIRMAFALENEMIITAFNPQSDSMETYTTLIEYIDKIGRQLEGHLMHSERFGEALVVYVREQLAAGRLEE